MYGDVFLGVHKETGARVAIKKLKSLDDQSDRTFDMLAVREIKILKAMDHPNVIKMVEVATDEPGTDKKLPVYMIMPCMKHDLRGLLEADVSKWWDKAMIKGICHQLLCGIQYLHGRNVIHRDLKPENLLMDDNGYLKIADFGLAKVCEPEYKLHTNSVVTLWYRSPELLLGTQNYDASIDIWAAGCIVSEVLMRQVLMPGQGDAHQLELVWYMCGTPRTQGWRAGTTLPLYREREPSQEIKRDLGKILRSHKYNNRRGYFTDGAVALIDRMLQLEPRKRAKAGELVMDAYFHQEAPKPKRPERFIKYSRSYFSSQKEDKKRQTKKRKTGK